MEDLCPGTRNFSKVPCTLVTSSAYVHFSDIFGNVERIGTGSSHESGRTSAYNSNCNIDEDEEEKVLTNVKDNRFKGLTSKEKCGTCKHTRDYYITDPYVIFLQEKQVEVLGALHDEIRILKNENAELKFQIHVILRDHEGDEHVPSENAYRGKMVPSTPESYLGDLNGRFIQDKEETLELELESAAKMIEELKWVKLHYEKMIRSQEIRICDLERQLTQCQADNLNHSLSPMKINTPIPPTLTDATEMIVNSSSRPKKSARQRSSSINLQQGLLNRRNSLQSLLPDDYKMAVATLPPILGNVNQPIMNGIPTQINAFTDSSKKCESSNGRSRKSAVMYSQTSALGHISRSNNINHNNNDNNTLPS